MLGEDIMERVRELLRGGPFQPINRAGAGGLATTAPPQELTM
jgi:hypothetical protein